MPNQACVHLRKLHILELFLTSYNTTRHQVSYDVLASHSCTDAQNIVAKLN